MATDEERARQAAARAGLTQREHEVLVALADGRTPAQIARELDIAISTARGHAKQLREKLDCTSVLQSVVTGARLGMIPGVVWSRP